MTEQQAQAIEIRLTRIWEPDEDGLTWDWIDHMLQGHLKIGLYFAYSLFAETFTITAREGGILEYFEGEIHDWGTSTIDKATAQFTARWLPFFRRSCWLSGANIEATAHEKAEWLVGFTREEIELWNLRL